MDLPEIYTFSVATPLDRPEALARRDEIIRAMEAIGVRLSLIDSHTDVRMVDGGLPTLRDWLDGNAGIPRVPQSRQDASQM